MSEYNIQMNKYNALNAGYDQLYPVTKIEDVNGLGTALQKKAPAGYGLGETPNYIADANDAIKNGWYAISSNTLNLPEPTTSLWNYTYLKVDVGNRPDSYIKQTITSPYQHWHQCEVTRCFYDARGGWQPWEWVNPPMLLGVEYRTTERYLGKPVYTKLVDCGAMPSETTKTVDVGVENLLHGVSVKAMMYYSNSDNWTLPIHNGSFDVDVWFNHQGINIRVQQSGLSAYTCYATIKYTKTTD